MAHTVRDMNAGKRAYALLILLFPRDHTLAFVNAGHNPPVVLCGEEVLRLEADGPVVGLLPHAQYGQSSLVISPGDILLAYTDGISEAMTSNDAEWGEDSMISAALASRGLPAGQMIDRLMAADAFTAGAPQHDDMTLVIVKLFRKLLITINWRDMKKMPIFAANAGGVPLPYGLATRALAFSRPWPPKKAAAAKIGRPTSAPMESDTFVARIVTVLSETH